MPFGCFLVFASAMRGAFRFQLRRKVLIISLYSLIIFKKRDLFPLPLHFFKHNLGGNSIFVVILERLCPFLIRKAAVLN